MGWLSLIPWRVLVAAALAAGLAWLVHAYGVSRFEQGAASQQSALDQAVHKAEQLTLQNERNARAAQEAKQEAIDEQAQRYQSQLAVEKRNLAAARAGADQLRDAIYRVAAARADAMPEGATTASGLDGRAAALGDVSASCAALATELQGQAEHLADQVRGLQAYAREVSAPNPPSKPSE